MIDHDPLLKLIRRFADAKDECCLAALIDDHRDETARLLSELRPDHRGIVSRLLGGRRGGRDATCPTS
jgi:hypothetical protein